jgi:hypothetical protein
MRERLTALGGSLEASPDADSHFLLCARLPLHHPGDAATNPPLIPPSLGTDRPQQRDGWSRTEDQGPMMLDQRRIEWAVEESNLQPWD